MTSTRKLAQTTSLTRQELRTLQKEGVTISDPKSLEARASHRAALELGRLKKQALETELLRVRLEREKGNLISVDQVASDTTAAVAGFTAELYAFGDDLPGQLVGLTEVGIRDRLLTRIDLLIDRVRGRWETLAQQCRDTA
jgi:hypothetical protein